MGSSNRGVTNVKLTSRVNYHQASDKMKLAAFMTGLASAQYGAPMNYQAQPMAPMGGGGMNNMMLPLLLLGDNGLSGSGSSSDMLLPLMLMGGMGGAGGDMGGMGGLLPLLLLGDSEYVIPTASLAPKCATITDLTKVAECNTLVAAFDTAAAACLATPTDACKADLKVQEAAISVLAGGSSSSNSDLLLLMAMGGMGGAGGAGGMNSMLPLLLLGDGLGSGSGGMSDMLLPLMLMQQPQIDPATGQPMAGGLGGMDPMLTLLMLGE